MQQTPTHTKANIDPLLFSPIVYETPRVMKFYRQHKNTIEKTPNQKKNIIMSLINSPMDPRSIHTGRLLLLKSMDALTEFTQNHYMPVEPRFKIPLGSGEKTRQPSSNSKKAGAVNLSTGFEIYEQTKEVLKTTMIGFGANQMSKDNNSIYDNGFSNNTNPICRASNKSNEMNSLSSSSITKEDKNNKFMNGCLSLSMSNHLEESDEPLKDITNRYLGKNAYEIRKRKRKSNHQLKILKWEYEKEGAWNKDKILNVSKITGLSESQVYNQYLKNKLNN